MSRSTPQMKRYLIGYEKNRIHGRKLPTNKQVLSLFFYQHSKLNLTIRESATATVEEVMKLWYKAGIPTRRKQHAIPKLEKLHKTWRNLQRNSGRKNSKAQKANEQKFKKSLDGLFDIAHNNAMKMLQSQDKRRFLFDQRRNRVREFSRSPSDSSASQSQGCNSENENVSNMSQRVEDDDSESSDVFVDIDGMSSLSSLGPSRLQNNFRASNDFLVDEKIGGKMSSNTFVEEERRLSGVQGFNKEADKSSRDSIDLPNHSTLSVDSIPGAEIEKATSSESLISEEKSSEILIFNSPSADDDDSDFECLEVNEGSIAASSTRGVKRSFANSNFEEPDEPARKSKKFNILTPHLAAALDRTKTSSRSATHILAAAATSLGHNIDDINLSHSAIHRNRVKWREGIVSNLKENLEIADCLVVHWDGKLLPEIVGSGNVERLPVVISGLGTAKLLGVPKMKSGTGANQAAAVIETLTEWNVTDRVKAMCFDTTSTNTGRLNGACALIEKTLQRKLIYLPCRHHIYELILRSVFEIHWPTTVGPNVQVFKRFQNAWTSIDTLKYEIGLNDEFVSETLAEKKAEILSFILDQLQNAQPRDDYREFLELSYIFLGETPPRGIKFKAPGAMHHARWLSKAIYSLKIFIFKSQFTLTVREINGLRHICVFIVRFYVKAWFTAPLAISAPYHDLKLLKDLINYEDVDAAVSKAARTKLAAHLWYISEDLVALALFDKDVPFSVKEKMLKAMKDRGSATQFSKRVLVDARNVTSWVHKKIDELVTRRSLFLFEQFGVSKDFLDIKPELWSQNQDFQEAVNIFTDLKVVNDIAERGVALIEQYNDCLTKNEEQKQYMLQVVQNHRELFPNCHKKTLKS